jgi:hypothetical protein
MKPIYILWTKALLMALIGHLAGCGGGSVGTSPSTAAAPSTSSSTSGNATTTTITTSTTYTSVAAPGELLSFTLDPVGNAFSYNILDSAFGLTGRNASGNLVRALDGAFALTDFPNTRFVALPGASSSESGIMIGVVREILTGATTRTIPIIGIETPATTLAAVAANYNYVGTRSINNGTSYAGTRGTLTVTADGAWSLCGTGSLGGCEPAASGTLNALGEGRWQLLASGTSIGTLAAARTTGQRLAVVDVRDPRATAAGGLGIGALVAAASQTIESSLANGVWTFNSTDGTGGFFNVSGLVVAGLVFGGDTFASTLTLNAPGTGFIRNLAGGVGLMASPGVYVLEQNGRLEIGIKIR